MQGQATEETAERSPAYREIVDELANDPTLSHVYYDISWDEVAKYAIASPETERRTAEVFNSHPDRFVFRHRQRRAVAPGDATARLSSVGPSVGAADARGAPQDPQGQLRAHLRRRARQGTRLGEGQRKAAVSANMAA